MHKKAMKLLGTSAQTFDREEGMDATVGMENPDFLVEMGELAETV